MKKRIAFLTVGIAILLLLTLLPWAARLGEGDNGSNRFVNYYAGIGINGNLFMSLSGILTAAALLLALLHLFGALRSRPIVCGILLILSTVSTMCCLLFGAADFFSPLTVVITVGQALAAVYALLGCQAKIT
ncbi:MAG: hypothetical protein ACI3VU_08470 [Faecousia sp.]|nr:hypothetical protein [Bacillota bacterium]